MVSGTYTYGRSKLEIGSRILIMGILNVTPDSFFDGGQYYSIERAVEHARRLVDDGADIIDIGGESTRPGAESLATQEELRRVIPVIERVRNAIHVPISVDTYKSSVAEAAIKAGADIVNDIGGLRFDPQMADVVRENGAGCILMHNAKTHETMHEKT